MKKRKTDAELRAEFLSRNKVTVCKPQREVRTQKMKKRYATT
jgi:hypothetical protein